MPLQPEVVEARARSAEQLTGQTREGLPVEPTLAIPGPLAVILG